MRLLADHLAKVETKIGAIEALLVASIDKSDFTRGLDKLRDPKLNRETHCHVCGLPHDKHVSHDPPEAPRPQPADFDDFLPTLQAQTKLFAALPEEQKETMGPTRKTPADWEPYLRAQAELYRGALQKLSHAELVLMPLPISKRRLLTIAEELRARLANPPPTRYDMLNADDEDS